MDNVGNAGAAAGETTAAGQEPALDGTFAEESAGAQAGRTSAGRGEKAPKDPAKAERKVRKASAKSERRAHQAAAKAERKAAQARKAAAKAERKAAKVSKGERKALEKAITRIAMIDRKVAKDAARPGRVDALMAGDVEAEPGADSVAGALADLVPPGGAGAGKRGAGSQKRARELAGRAGSAAIAAGGVLHEVAGLMRQATEPAASRIVQRVTRRSGAEIDAVAAFVEAETPDAGEPEHDAALGFEVVDAVVLIGVGGIIGAGMGEPAQPEPEVAAPEPAPAPDLEPEAAAAGPEPEPEPEAAAAEPVAAEPEPEPEPEPADLIPWPIEDLTDRPVLPALEAAPVLDAEPEPESDIADTEPGPGATVIVVPPGTVVGAAVDIGSTSVHLLVAAVGDHLVEPLLDESVFLGLGDRVATDGYLGTAARESLVEVLAAYVETARHLGAADVTLIGTEPLRRAEDGPAVVHAVEARTGVALHVLDHDEEGMLTLLGVTMGRALHSELLVLDIGGGSTELVFVGESGPVRVAGLRLGAAGLTRDLARADPPTLAETGAMRAAAHRLVADAPTAAPADVVAVGGTASNLLRLLPATVLDRTLTRRRITVALAMLAVEQSADAAARHLIRPERARILPAGAIIVDTILEHYGLDRLRVSEWGMREGAVLAAAKAGPGWRDRLPALVHGWEDVARDDG
jgi:exopolyphosphatase / guanosine-5'-triphosphate,3'-diphosphate pyrophosphatase